VTVRIETLTGEALTRAIPDLARLRIEVFRDWPYLYDGSADYEQRYIRTFSETRGAVIIAAIDGDRVVGAATAAKLAGHAEDFAEPFARGGYDVGKIFYFGESVLQKAYRGRGIGHAFFDQREAHARRFAKITHTTFCAVQRPDDHPLRPKDYVPLDAFWKKRGYARVEGLVGSFTWPDIGETEPTPKPMQFWMKAL
jgi:GNAT superfamily N-acetyltransferase